MFLTQIKNISIRKNQITKADPDKNRGLMHRAITFSLAPNQGSKFLFRYDKEEQLLILVSEYKPSFDYFNQFFEINKDSIKQITYEDRFKNIKENEQYRFYIETNAVTRHDGKNQKPVLEKENLISWMEQRANNNGFTILHTEEIETKTVKGKQSIPLYIAEFSGILQITDIEKFKNALINGVGRSKTYGCGLLWIERI